MATDLRFSTVILSQFRRVHVGQKKDKKRMNFIGLILVTS